MARSPRRQQRSRQNEAAIHDEENFEDDYVDDVGEDYEDDEGYDEDEGDYLTLDEIDPHEGLRGFSRTPFVTLLALSLVIHAGVIVGTSMPWLLGFSESESVVEETFDAAQPERPAPETPAQDPTPQPAEPSEPQDADSQEDPDMEDNEHIRRLQEAEPAPSDSDASREAQESLDRLSLP
ncbi:MAG: hypothetical protein EA401_04310 [Planctomycetota bacterium]|nr:MAG: hypothetical protein EA401_04310 [Planctomycetota bacterium]